MSFTKIMVIVCLCGVAASASARESLQSRLKDSAVKMVMSAMPTNEMNEAAGFFGPVSKKYKPTFERFWNDFRSSKDRLSVLADYLPKAEEAYADAQAMKVPEKYAAKKAEYLNKFSQLLSAAKISVAALGRKDAEKKEEKNEK